MARKLSANNVAIDAGAFVKTLKGSTGVGFADGFHVHKDWMAKTIGYDDALAIVDKAASERKDYRVAAKDIAFGVAENDKFGVKIEGRWYHPTDLAFCQMSKWMGLHSQSILREMASCEGHDRGDAETMVHMVNNGSRRVDLNKQFFIRTYADGTLRAWFSDRYAPVDNRWLLETMREFLPSARLSHWKSTEDTLWGNLLLPDSMKTVNDGQDNDFGCMLSMANCEIGTRRINNLPSIFRAICMNGCIWGQLAGEGINKKHVGEIDLADLKLQIAECIKQQLPIAAKGIDDFLATRNLVATATMETIVGTIAEENKLKPAAATRIFQAWDLLESENVNLYGLVNAVTRAGQSFDSATWYDFDVLGGRLAQMSPSEWDRINARAKNASLAKMVETFGVAV